MSTGVTLNGIYDASVAPIGTTETDLQTMLASLGPDSTAQDMLALQAKLTINSTTISVFSSFLKERGDVEKGIMQKVG